MLILSSRKNFTDTIFFSDNYTIETYESFVKTSVLDQADLMEMIHGKNVCLLIHGYNSDFDRAMVSYETIMYQMKQRNMPYDYIIGYMWPGSKIAAAFKLAEWRSDRAGVRLATIVKTFDTFAKSVDVQTHSLGARVALEAQRNGANFRNIFLSAPAVESYKMRIPKGKYSDLPGNIFNFYSTNDTVLKWDFFLSEFTKALGFEGIPVTHWPKNYVQFNCSPFIHSHSDYKQAAQYFDKWKQNLTYPIDNASRFMI